MWPLQAFCSTYCFSLTFLLLVTKYFLYAFQSCHQFGFDIWQKFQLTSTINDIMLGHCTMVSYCSVTCLATVISGIIATSLVEAALDIRIRLGWLLLRSICHMHKKQRRGGHMVEQLVLESRQEFGWGRTVITYSLKWISTRKQRFESP